jgi:hypothetical protein
MSFSRPLCLFLPAVLLAAGCAPSAPTPEQQARDLFKQARAEQRTPEQRAALYLHAADEACRTISRGGDAPGRAIYNRAATDLAILLRTARQGTLWNRPLVVESSGFRYRIRFTQGTHDGIWDPTFFSSLVDAAEVDEDVIPHKNQREGVGGALVGVRKTSPLDKFSPHVGVTAPVTAVLDFNDRDVTLTLVDPTKRTRARCAGTSRVVCADFSAPLAYYPKEGGFIDGLMGAIHVTEHMGMTGLYELTPHDPERIPLVFVHGLISSPTVWRNVIHELERDPIIRRRYQCLVFAYPTGNPPAYSALRLRDELAAYRARYPKARDMVMVGHSMGGLLTRMQNIELERHHWDVIGKDKAAAFFRNVKPGDLIHRCTIYPANPHIDRAVFICTPHRGSKMAMGTLGELAIRLIQLPADLAQTAVSTLGSSLAIMTGNSSRVPTSIDGLSPKNPAFQVYDKRPIAVPYHSIIGDRGKGDTPNSSDGVVEYWSSHLPAATSETIVPGPHSSCELPETIAELRRILHLHLTTTH